MARSNLSPTPAPHAMTTKTPETDGAQWNINAGDWRDPEMVVDADFARQLETDRDQLRARVSELEAENARLRLAAAETDK